MKPSLDKQRVNAWLKGQRAAAQQIEQERLSFLLNLTPEEALRVYQSVPGANLNHREAEPSPLLFAMRRLLARFAQEKGVSP